MTWALVGVGVGGDDDAWESIGFTVADKAVALANGAVLLGGVGFVVHPRSAGEASEIPPAVDGVPLATADVPIPATDHPNGAIDLDHVVIMTDSLERTSSAIDAALGLSCRRIRETGHVRQAFHRFPDVEASRGCIVEVVESSRVTGAAIWGLVVNVGDLDATCERLGPGVIGAPKPAVQPGRRIATIRREAALPTALAFMSR